MLKGFNIWFTAKKGGLEYILSVVGHWLGQTRVLELATLLEIVLFYTVYNNK